MRVLFAPLLLLLAACEGKELSFEQTQAYFQKHAGDLRHIIELVEACRPVYPVEGSYNPIRLDEGASFDPPCASGGASRFEEIKTAMRKADIIQADIRLTPDGPSSVAKANYADFSLYSGGLAVSGVGVDVIYYENLDDVPKPPYKKGYELRSLGAELDHWFWRRWAN